MKNHLLEKLENPVRLKELNPTDTLQRLGIADGDTVCDIGTGSGIFALAAAKLTSGIVYAVDVNGALLKFVKDKAQVEGLQNIKPMLVDGFDYDIERDSVHLALLVCVLHEIENKTELFAEIKRILKPTGKLCIIEFKKEETTMGPPVFRRIGIDETIDICKKFGFMKTEQFYLGENLYCIAFIKNGGTP